MGSLENSEDTNEMQHNVLLAMIKYTIFRD